jgi:BirA family biotin operon repressor/biotin-[acetyl-CoA-carboxylase] ligase
VFERQFRHASIDSTNERAFAALAAGTARHGDVHVALEQTAGRGRRGRVWVSPSGEGVYLSLILMPEAPLSPVALTTAAGLAVLDAARALGLQGASLAWPNDVMVGPKKLAGILVETRGLDPRAPHYVIGVGLNVAQRAFPADLTEERGVTSLTLSGVTASVRETEDALLARLAQRLELTFEDSGRLAKDYLDACGLRHRRVRVAMGSGAIEGELLDLSIEAGMTVRDPAGVTQRLALEFVRAVQALG